MSKRAKKIADRYLIDINDYKIIRNINSGGFGIINLVQNKKNGQQYAAKTNLIQNKSQNKLYISREVRILSQIQHSTVIQFKGFSYIDFDGRQNITILMDYMKEGSLANLLDLETKCLCPRNYDNTKRQIILVGIARGMMLLHKRYVIHRDLKPENILLDSDFHPRITDFGLSKFFDPHHSMNQSMADSGTATYMAPEVISSDHFNTKADVYAFGILMYEVIGGKRAYCDLLKGKKKLNEFQLKQRVLKGLRPKIDFPMKKGLQRMIEKCWSEDPKERPTFDEIFKKLSLSNEDYILEFEGNYEEPKIMSDEDDDDEDNEEDEMSGMSRKYCLEDVDTDELLDYVDEIKEEEPTATASSRDDNELRQQVMKMADKISALEKEKKEMIQSFENDKKEMIQKFENQIRNLESKQSREIENLKKRVDSLEKQMNNSEDKNELIQKETKTKDDRHYKSASDKKKESGTIECKYEGDELCGIISYMKKNCGDSLKFSDAGDPSACPTINLFSYDSDHINDVYENQRNGQAEESDGWVEVDFRDRKVNLTSYTIRSCANSKDRYNKPKSWRIAGSNDRSNWDVLDHQVDCSLVNGEYMQHKFDCTNNHKFYRYIRYKQEDSWSSRYPFNIRLTCLELFGSISK
ncbi:hypothetical protein M9Y10_033064 [Tritrichomonas musculus]|uniref:Protein kinase domain-containing protein n=1 Tax=Tritrichomonas musculus TaxID=1915356 RepID=A0ABR2GXY9_9EUKA